MKKLLVVFFALIFAPASLWALTAEDAVVTTAVVERQPVDRVETYPAQNGKLYCFSRITGATAETRIEHRWFFDGKELARVPLPVGSSNWRTYSSKKIQRGQVGQWQVKIVDVDENVLATVSFRVE